MRVTIKTLPGAEAPLLAALAELHPYQLPQVIAGVERASPAYAAWVRSEVKLS